MTRFLMLLGLIAFGLLALPDKPTPAQCCIDPAIASTCDKAVYQNDNGTLSPPIRCAAR